MGAFDRKAMSVPFPFRLLAPFLACLLLAPFASAEVKESREWIVDSRAHKFLTALAEKVGTEDTELAKGHAVATLSISGCNLSVLVVGPVGGDARAYARTIDAWRAAQGFAGTVEWSKEDDCAAATYRYRPGKVGMAEATTRIDLPGLREALLKAEPHTQFAVADAAWSKADLGFPPDATSAQGTRYWNLTEPRAGLRPVLGTIRLPAWMPWLALAWFLVPIVGVLASFAVGIAIAKNARIPLAQRRKLYGRAVLGGSFGSLIFHSVLFVATVPTRLFDPLAQLWFGERFVKFALPIVPAFVIVPLLALPLMNRVEKRLMGPTDEEKALQEAEKPSKLETTKPDNRLLLAVAVPLMLVGFGLQFYADSLPKTADHRTALKLCANLLMFVPMIATTLLAKKPKVVVPPEALDELGARLRERVADLAARLGMDAPPSRVLTEAIYGRYGAVLDRKGVGVTAGALEGLEPGELDFLIAHELAHEKLGHLRRRRLIMAATMAVCLLPVPIVLLLGKSMFATPGFLFTPMLLPLVVVLPMGFLQRRMMQTEEFQADRLALQATGDPGAARRALRRITLNSDLPGVHDTDMSSHPTVGARLAALQ